MEKKNAWSRLIKLIRLKHVKQTDKESKLNSNTVQGTSDPELVAIFAIFGIKHATVNIVEKKKVCSRIVTLIRLSM